MLIPMEWLNEFIEIKEDPQTIERILTMAGLEVSGITGEYFGLDRVLIGEIRDLSPHPKAQDVTVCKVFFGEREIQIITTAQGLKVGRKMPTVIAPAALPTGQKIEGLRYKGVDSEGMMCSRKELGLSQEQEMYVLPDDAPIGKTMSEFLGIGTRVLDIELTSNRPDCLSITGVARELGALLRRDVRGPELDFPEEAEGKAEDLVKVILEAPDLCPRYTARVFKEINIAPSPLWMQRRLISAGMRPINNLVDITNYVMLEMGQPIHAFDFTRIKNSTIRVRRARPGEKLMTLDGTARELKPDHMVIADDEESVALAGIMGGELSEVNEQTSTILLESAYFDPISIRKTSRRLGIRTEASNRYEKGVDPNLADRASRRIAHLVTKLGAGKIVPGVVDAYPNKIEPRTLKLRTKRVDGLLGLHVAPETIRDTLSRLGFEISGDDREMTVRVPTFRPDVTIEVDLIEEVAQLMGYDNLPTTLPCINILQGRLAPTLAAEEKIRQTLIALHLQEISASSLMAAATLDKYPEPGKDRLVAPLNPMSEDYNTLRPSLFPSLLSVAAHNVSYRIDNLRLFEIGRGYLKAPIDSQWPYVENRELSIGVMGQNWRGIIREQEKNFADDFFTLKGVVENLMEGLGIEGFGFRDASDPRFTPGLTAELLDPEGGKIGILGKISRPVAKKFDIPDNLAVALIDLEPVFNLIRSRFRVKEISRFPAVRRDAALVVDRGLHSEDIVNAILAADTEKLIEDIRFFDLFTGGKVPKDKKSMAYSLTYRRTDRSLTNEEVDDYHSGILKKLNAQFGAEQRMF